MANKQSLTILNKGVSEWNAWREQHSDATFLLVGANLVDRRFAGANFSVAALAGADFTRADLTGANFRRAGLGGADFSNANLADAGYDYERGFRL